MAGFWHPACGVSIKEADTGVFLFQFFHHMDIQRVLKQGPWHFDNHLLVLGLLQEGQSPIDVPLYIVPFWVQVHNIPVGFMTEAVGKSIANFIGEFLEYDAKNNSHFLRLFMRIRVLVDVRKPLRRSKKIKKAGGKQRK